MNSLKFLAMNCGPLSEMIRGVSIGKFLLGALKNDFHVRLGHPFPDLPMDDIAAATVQETTEVVKGTVDVDEK